MINSDVSLSTNEGYIKSIPVGTTLTLSVTYHDNVGEQFYATNVQMRYRFSRYDLLYTVLILFLLFNVLCLWSIKESLVPSLSVGMTWCTLSMDPRMIPWLWKLLKLDRLFLRWVTYIHLFCLCTCIEKITWLHTCTMCAWSYKWRLVLNIYLYAVYSMYFSIHNRFGTKEIPG